MVAGNALIRSDVRACILNIMLVRNRLLTTKEGLLDRPEGNDLADSPPSSALLQLYTVTYSAPRDDYLDKVKEKMQLHIHQLVSE